MYSFQANWRRLRNLVVAVCAVISAAPVPAAEVADTLTRAATLGTRPDQAVLLAVAHAGERLIAVGERGLIVLSDDQARSWRQVPLALSVTLTAVSFPTPRTGWAVGHRGVILATSDAGQTWTRQLDGHQFAELAVAEAKAKSNLTEPLAKRALSEAEALVRDGADKPFLDVNFIDERRGLAVGAYGLCARTEDGGRRWTSCMAQLPNPKGAHLYAIARSARTVYIAGEQGVVLRSDDAGESYVAVAGAHTTSFFCIGIAQNGDVVLGSLRGAAYVSTDHGRSFEKLPADTPGSFSGATRIADGQLLMTTQTGQLLQYDPVAKRLNAVIAPPMAPLSGATQSSSGALVLVGVRGVSALPATPALSLSLKP